jgi:predicted CXXCH cytochrome family protein
MAQTQISRTAHNLTPSGPGTFREGDPTAHLCVFCHTPHNANPTRPLWNRALSGVTYTLYASSTLGAEPTQPAGSSRLCLSCHDGTLAMGSLRVPPKGSAFTLGPLTGTAVLGTDLSDDHPVSFTYDSLVAIRDGELADPASLPTTVRLDSAQQLQCTSCHNPHEDRNPKFLRVENRASALCVTCHTRRDWSTSSHATSPATWSGVGSNPWPHTPYTTVAENGCENCHDPHSAGLPARLLNYPKEEDNCLVCHNGAVAGKDIAAQFAKASRHPITSTERVHDPVEDPFTMARHVECQDCHNPHVVDGTPAAPPLVSGRLRRVKGISAAGTVVNPASFQYEICFTCHGLQEQASPVVVRLSNVSNVRLEYDTANPSFHPVEAPGRNPNVPSLKPPLTTSSQIFCADCHSSDSPTTGGQGPHGSTFVPILTKAYPLVAPPVTESPATFDLCYTCHERNSIMSNRNPSGFPHERHLARGNVACSNCHDAHGSRISPHLINFMLRDRFGAPVVQPNRDGRIEFQDLGVFQGQCFLLCHGEEHNPRKYP